MRNKIKSILPVIMVLALVLANSSPVYAAGAQTSKEEVVYALLADDGGVQGVYVVNKFTVDEAGEIVDYGSYADVRNMTDNGALISDAGTIRFDAPAGQFYYEGVMQEAQLPWCFSFRYTLDGKQMQAQELAGKSGSLRIDISITRNPQAEPSFFDEYALQMTVALDTERCQNITASGATAANAGSDCQLTYTVLPGNEKSITITADVQNFEMEPISVNGVRLNLDFAIDDEELLSQVIELMDGVEKLDDGANELLDGVGELRDGAKKLQDGAQSLVNGIAAIQSGIATLSSEASSLTEGSGKMLAALQQLQAELDAMSLSAEDIEKLVQASAQIQEAIDNAAAGAVALQDNLGYGTYLAAMQANGADVGALSAGNAQSAAALQGILDSGECDEQTAQALQAAIGMLNANSAVLDGTAAYFGALSSAADPLVTGLQTLSANYAAFHANVAELSSVLASLPDIMGELKAAIDTMATEYAALDTGIGAYTQGVAALASGFDEVQSGAGSLLSGEKSLVQGLDTLLDGCDELVGGTGTLREETDGMDEKITEKINEILEDVSGGDGSEVVSFASAQNRNIKSVQFIMRTSAIDIPEDVGVAETEQAEPSVWERFLNLFR